MKKKIFATFVLLVLSSLHLQAQELILDENFESGIPSDWSIHNGDGLTVDASVSDFEEAWIGLEDPFESGNHIAGSTSFFDPEGQAFRMLITPELQLGSYGNLLRWRSMSHDPSFPDWIMVLVSTSGPSPENFTDTLFRLTNEFPYWADRLVNLSDSGYVDMTIHLAFVNNTNSGFKLYLDDVEVEINNPLSTPELQLSQIAVYPNPASGAFLNVVTDLEIKQIEILDEQGRILATKMDSFDYLNLQDLESGIYFLRILTSSGIQTRRIVRLQ
jgi:hypothetical protein